MSLRGLPSHLFLLIVSSIPPLTAQTGNWYINTIAGTDRPVGDNGPATQALLNTPVGVVVDSGGNILFADSQNHRVRKIAPNGVISTVVGNGTMGSSGDNGAALSAQLITPTGLLLDSSGNLYIADYDADVIRKVTPAGIITTLAGTGAGGSAGDGGPATSANLDGPYALAIDSTGNIYVADSFNDAIRKVTRAGTITTAFKTSRPEGLAFDSAGNFYVSSFGTDTILKYTATAYTTVAGSYTGFGGDGGPATEAYLDGPVGIAIDAAGNIWFADSYNNRIREVTPAGQIQTIIGSGASGYNAPGTDPTKLNVFQPAGLFIDHNGLVYWTESGNHRLRKYDPSTHLVTEVAGSTPPLSTSGTATSLLLFNPSAAVTDSAGNLYIADTSNNVVRKIAADGTSAIVAGTGVPGFNGDSGSAVKIQLSSPQGLAIDRAGNLLIADTGNFRIRSVSPSGALNTLMGDGNDLPLTGTTAANALLIYPTSVATDPTGGYFVVDQAFQVVLHVDTSYRITLIDGAALGYFLFPTGVTAGVSGVAYIADTFNNRIVRYSPNGVVQTVAGGVYPGFAGDGGLASNAQLLLPYAVALDSGNNLYIADTGNSRIRKVDSSGIITTIAGNGQLGFSGDSGPATKAALAVPSSVNVDPSGNIEFADELNQRIRILGTRQQIDQDLTLSTGASQQTVSPGGTASVQITLSSVNGLAGPVTLSVSGVPSGITFQFSPSSTVSLGAGQTVTITATAPIPAGAAAGTTSLTFTASTGSSATILQKTSTVSLIITNANNLPQITSAGVVSAASFAGGGVSPGEIIAVFGQGFGPATLTVASIDSSNLFPQLIAGTRVLFDGVPAPLIYVASGQLAAIVPYAVAGKTTTQVQVEFNGQQSTPATVNVMGAAPALFNAGASTQAAALNQDGSVNSASNPSKAGSEIVLFGTGEGATNPTGVDGLIATSIYPTPLLKVTVTIGGEPAIVDYAAAAPYEVAGVIQINARIPADLPSGPAAVVVTVGTYQSTGTSTIAIQ